MKAMARSHSNGGSRTSATTQISGWCVGLVLGLCLWSGAGEAPPIASDKTVMRLKLSYAQGVLEAIATENYSLLATNAQQLNKLSRQASWQLRQAPEYESLTLEFRRATEALSKAAKKRNGDAATVAYFQTTLACVNCHKYLKESRVAELRERDLLHVLNPTAIPAR